MVVITSIVLEKNLRCPGQVNPGLFHLPDQFRRNPKSSANFARACPSNQTLMPLLSGYSLQLISSVILPPFSQVVRLPVTLATAT